MKEITWAAYLVMLVSVKKMFYSTINSYTVYYFLAV